jgi:hypothetical protein
MNLEIKQGPVIRNMADLNSCMARRLQAIYPNDFSEGLVNRMAAIIENGIASKRKDARDKGGLKPVVHHVEEISDGFAEWIDNMENLQLIAGYADCSQPNQALLLELVGLLVHADFNGDSAVVSDNVVSMLSRKIATEKCASMINEIAGLIYNIMNFTAKAGKKKTA